MGAKPAGGGLILQVMRIRWRVYYLNTPSRFRGELFDLLLSMGFFFFFPCPNAGGAW